MVELEIEGNKIELYHDQDVSYTKRAAEFGKVDKFASSYTNSFKAPKSLQNVKFFEGLGVPGDTSRFPYSALKGNLIDNGITILHNGKIEIKSTDSEYRLSIIDGIKDFFDVIRGKTIAGNTDLSALNHDKTLQTIIDSWNGLTEFKYLVANYGNPYYNLGVNANNLIPWVRLSYIFDKIVSEFAGYTYSGNFDLTKDWISYPKPVPQNATVDVPTLISSTSYTGSYNTQFLNSAYKDWTLANVLSGSLIANWEYVIPSTGVIKIETEPEGTMIYKAPGVSNPIPPRPYRWRIRLNGSPVGFVWSDNGVQQLQFNANQGDVIDFEVYPESSNEIKATLSNPTTVNFYPITLNMSSVTVQVSLVENQTIAFSETFGKMKMEEFFKEIMWRFALVPFPDNDAKHIHFMTMDERLGASTVDWTSKFIRRTNEKYEFGTYGQSNVFSMKYTGDQTGFNDGYVTIDNQNLTDEIEILKSFIHSPLKDQFSLDLSTVTNQNQTVWQFPMWEKDVKNLDNGDIDVEYKELNDRYYIAKEQTINKTIVIARPDANDLPESNNAFSFPIAITTQTLYSEIVPLRYSRFESVLNDTRIHEFDLALSASDILNLDMKKLYFFEQEHNRYLLNKITWKKGSPAKGEFLRVKGDIIKNAALEASLHAQELSVISTT